MFIYVMDPDTGARAYVSDGTESVFLYGAQAEKVAIVLMLPLTSQLTALQLLEALMFFQKSHMVLRSAQQ